MFGAGWFFLGGALFGALVVVVVLYVAFTIWETGRSGVVSGPNIVDIEKLRELEWGHGAKVGTPDGIVVHSCGYCNVCHARKFDGHKDNCWLGNKLKASK